MRFAVLFLVIGMLLFGCVNNTGPVIPNNGSTLPDNGGTGGTDIIPPITAFSFSAPSELPVAMTGEHYTYRFQTTGGDASHTFVLNKDKHGDFPPGFADPADINLTLKADGTFEGTLRDGSEGVYTFGICTWDSSAQNVCRNTTLYVMSNFVTVKGTGSVRASLYWLPGTKKTDSGIYIVLKDALDDSAPYMKTVAVYDLPRQGTGNYWTQAYQTTGGMDLSHPQGNIYPVEVLKGGPLEHEATLAPKDPSGGATASGNIDVETSVQGSTTTFDITFGTSASAPCGTTSADHPYIQFYTDNYETYGRFTPILELTNTGTSPIQVDLSVHGKLARSAHDRSDAYGNIAFGVQPSTHFYAVGDIAEKHGQYAEGVWDSTKSYYQAIHKMIDIIASSYSGQFTTVEDSSTTRFVLAPGRHLIPLGVPGSASSIYFSVQGSGVTADNCNKADAITGEVTMVVRPI